MNQTRCFGLLAALFLAAIAPACNSTETSGGGCQDDENCTTSCPEEGLPQGACAVEGQVCSDLNECGYGQESECRNGYWGLTYVDPIDTNCGCNELCIQPCPDEKPVQGSACYGNFSACMYPDPMCANGGEYATCNGGMWTLSDAGCIKKCPTTLPVDGTPCDECCSGSTCAYLDMSGCPAHIACQNGVWVTSSEACTPTSACSTMDKSLCSNAQGCRWIQWMPNDACLTPEGGFPQGCYPVDDCASDADCNGGTCKTVAVDPCPAGGCNLCPQQAQICVP